MPRFLLTFFALFLLTAAPAQAADINEQGAAALKTMIDETMAHYQQMGRLQGQEIKLSAPATVVPKGNFYEVKLPGLEISADNILLKGGNITINAVPGKSGEYLTSMALPKTMVLHDTQNKKDIAQVTVGKQKFTGVWRPELRAYTQIDAAYENIGVKTLNDPDAAFTLTTGKTTVQMKLTPDAGGATWSGASLAEVNGLVLDGRSKEMKQVKATLEKFVAKNYFGKINLKAGREMGDKMAAFFKDKKPEDVTPEQMSAFARDILKNVTSFMDSEKHGADLTKLSISMIPADGGKLQPFDLTLAQASSQFDMNGVQSEKGNALFKTSFKGLSYKQASPLMAGLIPSDTNFDISFDNLPMKSLGGLFGDLATTALEASVMDEKDTQVDQKKNDMGLQLMALPGLLQKSGASVTVRDTFIRAADLTSYLDGKITAQASALSPAGIPAQGNMTLVLEGLDEAVLKYQAKAAETPELTRYVQSFGMLQLMGKEGKTATGKSTRTYRLDITPDGKILMNGQDMSAMGAMMGGGMGMPR